MTEKPRRDAPRGTAPKLTEGAGFDLNQALRSVVTVQATIPENAYTAETLGEQRAGSGVVIRESGLVLTIGYLITEAETVWLQRRDGHVVPGHALAIDAETGFDCPTLELGRSSEAFVGDPVVIAAGAGTKTVQGSIVAKQEFAGYWEYFLDEAIFTSPAHPFWGGAAAINSAGKLIGIGSLHVEQLTSHAGSRDVNMIVPIDLLSPILADLLAFGRVNKPARPWLGIYSAESGGQIVVAAVADDGPAAQAGLRRGDVLASVRGEEVVDLGDFYRRVWRVGAAGVEIPVEFIRDGRALGVRIQSADRASFLKRPTMQ